MILGLHLGFVSSTLRLKLRIMYVCYDPGVHVVTNNRFGGMQTDKNSKNLQHTTGE